jgi:hypothetical protein
MEIFNPLIGWVEWELRREVERDFFLKGPAIAGSRILAYVLVL